MLGAVGVGVVSREAGKVVALMQMLMVLVVLEARGAGIALVENGVGDVLHPMADTLGRRVDRLGQLVEQPPAPARLFPSWRRLDNRLHKIEESITILRRRNGREGKSRMLERLPKGLHSLDKAIGGEAVNDTKVVDLIERLILLVGRSESTVICVEAQARVSLVSVCSC